MALRAIDRAEVHEEPAWFLRVAESARLVGVSPDALYKAIYSGSLKARKFRGRGWLIAREDLEAWIESETTLNVA